jgi:hypothetical protein
MTIKHIMTYPHVPTHNVILKNGEKYYNISRNPEYNEDQSKTCVVAGKPIVIKELPEYKFFTQRTESGLWSISEVSTGLCMFRSRKRRKDLLEDIKSYIKNAGIDQLERIITDQPKIEEYINDVVRIKKPKENVPYSLNNKRIELNVVNFDNKIIKAIGNIVVFDEYPDYTFFVAKTIDRKWSCYECTTGLAVKTICGTRKSCLSKSIELFNKMDHFKKIIEECITENDVINE